MATVDELTELIQEVIQDESYTEDYIVARQNDIYLQVAGGQKLPEQKWGMQISPPLPDLLVIDDTVWSSPSLPYITLPTNFQRKVEFAALKSTRQRIEILNTFVELRKRYPLLDFTDQIQVISVNGRIMYYQGKPSYTATTSAGITFTATGKTITDANKGFTKLKANMVINISGSASNDGDKKVVTVATDGSYCTVSDTLILESSPAPAVKVTYGEQLITHYYGYPETLKSGGVGPLAIPVHFHDNIIVNGVAAYIYNLIEDGIEDAKINTKKYTDLFTQSLEELSYSIPAEAESFYTWPDEGRRAI